ncbi:/ / hypothetical protein / 526561:527655 Reverse [Candidatus Hepatoplasma crinochetorum]|uniref:Uncharacterized protein n=1 Tax=Candidatus Hepatoplasma crinochetorum TaxID=295596 RepID=A0A0G7ZN21_9MOLU|nr:/ / hypothetical protein / 526561:527655 Reverse [Candidatus Hepatoplasma crinochetorum]
MNKENGFYKEIKEEEKRKKINSLFEFWNLFQNETIKRNIEINENFYKTIKDNEYYRKIWNLFNRNNKIDSEEINNKINNNIPFTSENYLNNFFSISNTYNYKFIEYIYDKILKINYKKNENISFQIFGLFYKLQDTFRKLIGDQIYNFEYFLRIMLMVIMRKNNLTFSKIKFCPQILQKINKESDFYKSIKLLGTDVDKLKESNEFLEIIFEEMNFEDYIGLIQKINDDYFSELLKLLFSNLRNINYWESIKNENIDVEILEFNKLESIILIKKEFIDELEKIKFLRNKIYHNKTIIFKNWLNQKYEPLCDSIEALYKLFYFSGKLQILGFKSQLKNIVENFRENLTMDIPYKQKEINDYLKDLI